MHVFTVSNFIVYSAGVKINAAVTVSSSAERDLSAKAAAAAAKASSAAQAGGQDLVIGLLAAGLAVQAIFASCSSKSLPSCALL